MYCFKKNERNEYEDKLMDYKGNIIPINTYISNINKNGFYSGDFEISESVHLFNINILIFKKCKTNDIINYKYVNFFEHPNIYYKDRILVLVYKNNNHYEIISHCEKSTIKNLNGISIKKMML